MGGTAPVVGRLLRNTGKESDLLRGASLTVCRTLPSPTEENEASGIVLVGSISLSWERLHDFRCPVFMLPELPERCMGKIALLDTESGRLFVSPDLSVVSRYASYFDGESILGGEEYGAETTAGDCLRQASALHGAIGWRRIGCWLEAIASAGEESDAEECLYERYREMAEREPDSKVTVLLGFSREDEARERFRRQIRGIFRAAVYGRFSLLVRGCMTEGAFRECLGLIHRCYCELAFEGREFNGYIPKGLLLECPLQLAMPLDKIGADFLCLDKERMLSAMMGGGRAQAERLTHEERVAARGLLSRLRSEYTGIPLCLLLRESVDECAREGIGCDEEIDTWYICRKDTDGAKK